MWEKPLQYPQPRVGLSDGEAPYYIVCLDKGAVVVRSLLRMYMHVVCFCRVSLLLLVHVSFLVSTPTLSRGLQELLHKNIF